MPKELVCDCEVIHEETVLAVKEQMLSDGMIDIMTVLLKMMADSTRLRILWALSKSEMCVCDIAILLDMTKSAISHQLKALRLANLITPRREGKVIYYSLADSHVLQLLDISLAHADE